MDILETVKIRALAYGDLDAIVAIDKALLGKERPEYWSMKIELTENRAPMASLVAELDGSVIGFILGDVSGWEYGVPDTIGWIDIIGVHPTYQRKGVARILFKAMVANMKKVGVDSIYTFVNWREFDRLNFFDQMGFQKGDLIHLELKLGT
ncbi:MAG: GNAT family N-acetyltransferase [Deltaproteobacteria bacterium RBG_16_54_18]|jgi:N-acetylglutamate synthase-like GNAT family acetyltransferase|nr:MAG: GNAT family N-acetyltransferase [Deltaproteobacteria bacterium RBG_16_54_18]